jgi:PAS domain S-box-containing protein
VKNPMVAAVLRFLKAMAVGAFLLGVAFCIRYGLDPWLGERAPYGVFILPVLAAAWMGGSLAGLLTTGFAAVLATYFFMAPRYSLQFQDAADMARPGIFLIEGIILSVLMHVMGRSKRLAVELAASESQARHEIEQVKNLLQLSTNQVPAAIAYVDKSLRYSFLNETYRSWTGKDPKTLVGAHLREIMGEEQFKEREGHIRDVLAGKTVNFEGPFKMPGGTIRKHAITYTPDRDETGQVRGFVVQAQDITDARASEELFRNLTDNLSGHAFYVVEYNPHRISFASPGYEEIWGRSRQELFFNPRSFMEAVHPEDLPKVEEAAAALAQGYASSAEYRITRPDGSERWVLDRYFPVRDATGSIVRAAGIAADITDRKHVEIQKSRMLESERHFRIEAETQRRRLYALLQKAPGQICVVAGPDLRIEFANEAYTTISGMGDLTGRKLADTYQGLPDWVLNMAEKVGLQGERFTAEEIEVPFAWHGEGKVYSRYFNMLFEPMFGLDGRPDGFISFSFDITAQVLARKQLESSQAALRETERSFRDLAEAVPHLVWTAEPDGRPLFFNRRWVDYLGTAPEASFGGDWSRFLHPDDMQAARLAWTKSLRSGERLEQEVRILRKDGSYRWHLMLASSVRGEGGRILRWYGTVTDIQDLREAMTARDRLLSICSHELKTPVTAMKLQNQLIRRGIDKKDSQAFDPARITTFVERNEAQLMRLSRLIDEMLDFSRISQGKFSVNVSRGNLSTVITEAVDRMRPQFEARGVPLQLEVEPNLTGDFDSLRIEQVLSNLLDNALKYGEGKPVGVEATQSNGMLDLKVIDLGAGIAPEYHERIFEPYERALSPESITGLGMGLYITRQIMQAHDGQITVSSVPRRGTVFRVHLPLEAKPRLYRAPEARA